MDSIKLHRSRKRRGQGGQAIVEYMLLTVVCALVVSVTINNLRTNIEIFGMCRLWAAIAKSIAIGCPGCKGNTNVPDTAICLQTQARPADL